MMFSLAGMQKRGNLIHDSEERLSGKMEIVLENGRWPEAQTKKAKKIKKTTFVAF